MWINHHEGEEPRLAATPPTVPGPGVASWVGVPVLAALPATPAIVPIDIQVYSAEPVRVTGWPLIGPEPNPSRHRQVGRQAGR